MIEIKSWVSNIEQGAQEQAEHLAQLPFAFKHVALMPDCHQGYGMPIGGVLCTTDVVIPNAVGVDIGCGIVAVNTYSKEIKDLRELVEKIKATVPVGFKHQEEPVEDYSLFYPERLKICREEYKNALYQLGTLGGGNHFIEIQKDQDGFIWIMIHSGSRNLGYKIAKYYNEEAKKLNKMFYSEVPEKWDLAFLPLEHELASDYIAEMLYCVNFAKLNRFAILKKVIDAFEDEDIDITGRIDIAHNYVAVERHFGRQVYVHRKGATRAFTDEIGIIPGSQGTKSYIVKGLGNRDSFMSCSHGAGRKMGRNQARKNLDLDTELNKMEGILHDIRSVEKLDEAPGAYKDINEVMENQKDLVEIVTELEPLAVIKG